MCACPKTPLNPSVFPLGQSPILHASFLYELHKTLLLSFPPTKENPQQQSLNEFSVAAKGSGERTRHKMKHKPTTTTTLLLFLLLLSRKGKRRLMVVAKLLVKKEKKRRGHPSSSSFLLPSDYLEGPFFRLPRKRERRKDNDFLLSLSLQLLYLQCIVGRSLSLFSGTKREERRALEVRLRHRCFSSPNRNTPGLMRWTTLRVSFFRGRLRRRGGIWAKEIWKIRSFPRSPFSSSLPSSQT